MQQKLNALGIVATCLFLLALNFESAAAADARIINGMPVTWNSTRFQVSIRLKSVDQYFFGHGHACGGTIIARDLILTAAHCIWK